MLAILVLLAAAEDTYKLGGPRQVVATVATAEGDHVVTIRMLPVNAFDAATNERVARQLAEHYALQALAKHLAHEKGTQIEVLGGRVSNAGREGKHYTLTYRVAEKAVTLVQAGAAPVAVARSKRFAFDTPFFTRKRDLIEMARLLGESLAADLAVAEKGANPADAESSKSALMRIVELEEKGEGHWKKLRSEIRGDKLLLTDERNEALAAQGTREAEWLRLLGERARKYAGEK